MIKCLFKRFIVLLVKNRFNILFIKNQGYNLEFNIGEDLGFNWSSFINNHSVKTYFKYYANPKHEIGFGGASTYYIFEPGNAVARNSLGTNNFSLPNKYSMENALYITEDWSPNKKWTIRAGLRGSQFLYLGKSNVYYYQDAPIEGQRRFVDSVSFAGDNEDPAIPQFGTPFGLQIPMEYQRVHQRGL